MKKAKETLIAVMLAIVFIAIALSPFTLKPAVVSLAAPEAVRTEVTTLNSAAIATTTTWSGGRWSALGRDAPPTIAEVYWFIDVGTVNTTTFVLQVSPDNSTWVNHSTASALATNVVADVDAYTRTTIEGLYYRVQATATNTETLTPTIKVLLR